MKCIKLINLFLIGIIPSSWFLPIAYTGLVPWFGLKEISIVSSLQVLCKTNLFLCLVVFFSVIIFPMIKLIFLSLAHFNIVKNDSLSILLIVSQFSMSEVFILSFYIVITKSTWLGHLSIAWGFYVFCFATIISLIIALWTQLQLQKSS